MEEALPWPLLGKNVPTKVGGSPSAILDIYKPPWPKQADIKRNDSYVSAPLIGV